MSINANPPLPHISHNPESKTTLLLLHGAFASSHEYASLLTSPHLASYHLLIPSLFTYLDPGPGPESASRTSSQSGASQTLHLRSLDLEQTTQNLLNLVLALPQPREVHVVGVSLGAHLGLHLVSHYPNLLLSTSQQAAPAPAPAPASAGNPAKPAALISSLFLSGLQSWPLQLSAWQKPIAHYGLAVDASFSSALPESMVSRMLDGWTPSAESRRVARVTTGLRTCREIVDVLTQSCELGREGNETVGCRTCIVVADKGSRLLPTFDNLEGAVMWREWISASDREQGATGGRDDGKGGRESSENKSRHVKLGRARECRHMWHVMRPEAFAEALGIWVEEGRLGGVIEQIEP